MKPVDSRHLSGSKKVSAWFSDTAKKQAFSRSAWLEMGGVETNNPTTAAYHFISYKGKKGEIPPGINFALSTKMFYDNQIPPGSSLYSYIEVPGRSFGINEPIDEELLSLKGPTSPMAEPAVIDETVENDTSLHLIDSQIFGTNSQTPNPINDFLIPSGSQPCEREIQTRLLLSSSSDSDTSQAPITRHLASVLSPQPLECLYDVFNSTVDIDMVPAEDNGELIPDFGSGINTPPRVKHPSVQQFFTPEIQLLPDCTLISTAPEGNTISPAPSMREPTYSHPAVNTLPPPAFTKQPIMNDTLVHITGSHIPGTNSQTPIPINDSFSLPIPSGSQPCVSEIQTRLLLSFSDSDTSQTPNTRHLASVLSPQPLECLYDVFNSTVDIDMVPAEDNGELIHDFGSGINTPPRVKHPSSQQFFTPEIQLLPDCTLISTTPEGNTILRDPTYSPPSVDTQYPPAVNTVSLTESPTSSQHTTSDIQLREESVFSLQDSPENNSLHKFTFSPSSLLQSFHDITSGNKVTSQKRINSLKSYFSEKEWAFLMKYDQIKF